MTSATTSQVNLRRDGNQDDRDTQSRKDKLHKSDGDSISSCNDEDELPMEHDPPVFTIGKRDTSSDILLDKDTLHRLGIEVHRVGRGGGATWHGKGQLVVYPILDLAGYKKDVRWYVHTLEAVVQDTLAQIGIVSGTHSCSGDMAGVWVGPSLSRKICSIGIQLSRWVTRHGFALNVNPDLQFFQKIIPCGMHDPQKSITSIANELGYTVPISEVVSKLTTSISKHFECKINYE